MGEKLEKTVSAYEDLKAKYDKLEGELAMRKRGQHGKKSEKPKDSFESNPASDGSKDADEEEYRFHKVSMSLLFTAITPLFRNNGTKVLPKPDTA